MLCYVMLHTELNYSVVSHQSLTAQKFEHTRVVSIVTFYVNSTNIIKNRAYQNKMKFVHYVI